MFNMSASKLDSLPPDAWTIVTWNILLDNTKTNAGIIESQAARLPSQIATLDRLRGELGELDVVGLQEVHKANGQHNGECLSEALGYGVGQWVEHNQKSYPGSPTGRSGEHVGLFGARIETSEPIELGDNRRAIKSHVGQTAVVNIHTRAGFAKTELQEEQVRVVLDDVEEYSSVVFKGDFNNLLGTKPRRAIESAGFRSVFSIPKTRHPKTWPSPAYKKIMYSRARYLAPSVNLDDIYIRGLDAHAAGSFVGDSDHVGLWAIVSEN
jgi:endonuclease/exonuclease/phosphatase family metal-dependent hydrolase